MSKPDLVQDSLPERLQQVRQRITAAATRCNRSPDEITLVAISKTHPVELLKEAIRLGVTDLGENRVQEAEPKIMELGRRAARWHLVGHLQSNKARRAVQLFDVLHSLDSAALARRLGRLCEDEDRQQFPVLLQVDLGGEETKSGVPEKEVEDLASVVKQCSRLQLTGLMTLPPYFEEAEKARPFFDRLRELRDQLQRKGYFGELSGELSMGMTHDFEIAIEAGATMVRVGTAIFGARAQTAA
jgi:pyridoxal phosphate enzyme (YggS family)